MQGEVILRFEDVSFWYNENKPLLKEANFVLRKGAKLTLMGQNGAGKSTLLSLIMNENELKSGRVVREKEVKVAIAKQTIPHEKWTMTVREFLQSAFTEKVYDIDKKAKEVFRAVELAEETIEKTIKDLSGGQKGRLLIAQALIQKPDILMLDEPTNNLDKAGVKLLTEFMIDYPGTVIVISHDESFLNSFTQGILYVNAQNNQVEQYVGNYFKAVEEIKARIDRENTANAKLEREIQDKKDKVNFFANKGGKMRKLAAKLRDDIEEAEGEKVEVRSEDKTIKPFKINCQDELSGVIAHIENVEILKLGEVQTKQVRLEMRKGDKLQIIGPNGIGKTTLLEKIAKQNYAGIKVSPGVKVGYYRQDFSTLDFNKTAYEELTSVFKRVDEHHVRSVAAKFLLGGKELNAKIGTLSEGQKGLLMFAYLTLLEPGMIIFDEPTNHINFRHIPHIQEAIKNFEGPVIIVSHVNDFVRQIGCNKTLNLEKL
jgi:ATP-binding cassette, subfamily F, member 3